MLRTFAAGMMLAVLVITQSLAGGRGTDYLIALDLNRRADFERTETIGLVRPAGLTGHVVSEARSEVSSLQVPDPGNGALLMVTWEPSLNDGNKAVTQGGPAPLEGCVR
jgi:hypothetical protein